MDISSIADLVSLLPMAAADPSTAYQAGTGGSHSVTTIRRLIVGSTMVILAVWAAWAAWGRVEAYWEQRIHLKALLFDVIGVAIVFTVMLGLLIAGFGPI